MSKLTRNPHRISATFLVALFGVFLGFAASLDMRHASSIDGNAPATLLFDAAGSQYMTLPRNAQNHELRAASPSQDNDTPGIFAAYTDNAAIAAEFAAAVPFFWSLARPEPLDLGSTAARAPPSYI